MQKLIIASNDNQLNTKLYTSLENVYIEGIVTNQKKLLALCEKTKPDIVICSVLLPGENLFKAVFKVSHLTNARFIILSPKNHKKTNIKELFFLGVRDFIYDPINLSLLSKKINQPSTFAEALENINLTSEKSLYFLSRITEFKLYNLIKPQKKTMFSEEAKEILAGVTNLLELEEKDDFEEQLFLIEQKILKLFFSSPQREKI